MSINCWRTRAMWNAIHCLHQQSVWNFLSCTKGNSAEGYYWNCQATSFQNKAFFPPSVHVMTQSQVEIIFCWSNMHVGGIFRELHWQSPLCLLTLSKLWFLPQLHAFHNLHVFEAYFSTFNMWFADWRLFFQSSEMLQLPKPSEYGWNTFSLSCFLKKAAIFTEIALDKHPEWRISAWILKKLDRNLSCLYSILK